MRLIDADYLVKQLREQRVKLTGKFTVGINKGLNTAISIARNPDACPTIEAKPVVHGEWEETVMTYYECFGEGEWDEFYYEHKECGYKCDFNANFCPNCGADMRGET
jgi:hypothetical protein